MRKISLRTGWSLTTVLPTTGVTCLLLLLSSGISFSQSVQVTEESVITAMMAKYTEINKSKPTTSGWRVQVYATTDRESIDLEKKKFRQNFPGIWADWTHSSPYYRLKAGAFATKMEAQRLLYQLEDGYPGAFVVQDNAIRPMELIGY